MIVTINIESESHQQFFGFPCRPSLLRTYLIYAFLKQMLLIQKIQGCLSLSPVLSYGRKYLELHPFLKGTFSPLTLKSVFCPGMGDQFLISEKQTFLILFFQRIYYRKNCCIHTMDRLTLALLSNNSLFLKLFSWIYENILRMTQSLNLEIKGFYDKPFFFLDLKSYLRSFCFSHSLSSIYSTYKNIYFKALYKERFIL